MKCLWEWIKLEQSETMHVNLIEFRSAMERGGSASFIVKQLIARETEKMRSHSCELKYECNEDGYHRIIATRLDIPVLELKGRDILWEPEISKVFGVLHFDGVDSEEAKSEVTHEHRKAFELSLDAPPELLARFPGAVMQFAQQTVSSALRDIFENQSSYIRAEVKRIVRVRANFRIDYDWIFGDVDSIGEAVERIESSSIEYVHFDSLIIPVIFHREKVEMSLSEEVMKREVKKMRNADKKEDRRIKLMPLAVADLNTDLMMSTQNVTNADDVKQMVFERYWSLRHIDEMTDDDSQRERELEAVAQNFIQQDEQLREMKKDLCMALSESSILKTKNTILQQQIQRFQDAKDKYNAIQLWRPGAIQDDEDEQRMSFANIQRTSRLTQENQKLSNTKSEYGTNKESEFATDTETDEEERAELKKRVSMRYQHLAIEEEEAAVKAQLAELVGTHDATRSLITNETAQELSAEELLRQKREMQEHMALLMMSNTLPREENEEEIL